MDRRRIVTLAADGTPTTIKDLADDVNFFSVRDSFTVKAPARKTVMAQQSRRYGGATAVSESHENGAIGWKALVKSTTADNCNLAVEALLGVLESARLDLFFEWRPDGATSSVFYEVRGPAKWQSEYRQVQYAGAFSMMVDIEIPVGPLARVAPSTQTISSTTFPLHKTDLTAIGGDAPALCDVSIRASGGSQAPIWALIGWSKRPSSPLSGSVAPFGIIEAETGTLSTWAAIGTDANFRGSNGVRVTTSGSGSASAVYPVDPSTMAADQFTRGTVDIEVWARIELGSGVVSPRLTLSLEPNAGSSFGASQYSHEYGSTGKLLIRPGSGTRYRFVRLGTLTMPVDPVTPLKWNVKVAGTWATSSSGDFGLDYLVMVPVKQRACGKTGVANDGTAPKFIASTSDTTKTIRSDLSGLVGSAAGNQGRDSGLGGSPIELPPGNVDLVVVLSSVVPDDPTVDTSSMQLSHTSTTGALVITPRYWLVK